MPLNQRASRKIRSFDLPVSYRINESGEKLRDALNVFSNQGRLETRFGRSLWNAVSLGASVQSISFFKHANGTRYLIAKVGTVLYSVASTGAHTAIKTGLTDTTKHRGITWARGTSSRHIIAIESDGLFQWDGTTFTELGQAAPAACVAALTAGSLTNGSYKIYLTYYSSVTGFESNAGTASNTVTTSTQGIALSSIPSTATNGTIDKIRIYLKNTGSVDDAVYVTELSLGTTTYTISSNPTSTSTYPLANAAPSSGGAKFLTEFNRKLVCAGNGTYKNDVYFSEEDLPDAFNDGTANNRVVLYAPYDGEVTGIATGLYNNSVLDPYLVVFKKRSTHIYSEIGGVEKFVPISKEIGCASHDTISVKNGDVYFLSSNGWRVISNGRIMTDQQNNPATLGQGDLDDIFKQPGYVYEINKAQLSNSFSVYYSALDQYMTWVAEGAGSEFTKVYSYEFPVGGFKPYSFYTPATAACIGEDGNGDEVVFMSDASGAIYTHSINEARSDEDSGGTAKAIESFAMMSWMDGGDMDASYNFRELLLRRVVTGNDITIKTWINYSIQNLADYEITFSDPDADNGFILDESLLDEGVFSDGRTISTARADINRCGENILIGFYLTSIDGNLNLVSAQIDFSTNGNRNL
jgi:hypothetical protein